MTDTNRRNIAATGRQISNVQTILGEISPVVSSSMTSVGPSVSRSIRCPPSIQYRVHQVHSLGRSVGHVITTPLDVDGTFNTRTGDPTRPDPTRPDCVRLGLGVVRSGGDAACRASRSQCQYVAARSGTSYKNDDDGGALCRSADELYAAATNDMISCRIYLYFSFIGSFCRSSFRIN